MKVIFLGVGEACDERTPNTSVLLQTVAGGHQRSIMLDCGFSAPSSYWRYTPDPQELDALWISHFHGDHFFGVPALLLRFWEKKRDKPLAIVGQTGLEKTITQAMELAYPGFLPKLTYPVEYHEIEPGQQLHLAGLDWKAAQGAHGQRNLAVRIDDGRRSVFYSGDGLFTAETLLLARQCSLVIHEAFLLDPAVHGHGTVRQCIDFARKAAAVTLALVHVQRDERRDRYQDILRLVEETTDLHVVLPEPGDELEL